MTETAAMILIVIGVCFDLFGCIGLLRLPDVYNRLQSATKCVTVGTCFILAGCLLLLQSASGSVKGTVCIFFILLTSPTAAHALARAAHRAGIRLWQGSVVDRYSEDREGHPEGEQRP